MGVASPDAQHGEPAFRQFQSGFREQVARFVQRAVHALRPLARQLLEQPRATAFGEEEVYRLLVAF